MALTKEEIKAEIVRQMQQLYPALQAKAQMVAIAAQNVKQHLEEFEALMAEYGKADSVHDAAIEELIVTKETSGEIALDNG